MLDPLDSVEVLSYILKRAQETGIKMTYVKAQKLLYCCYGVVLAKFGVRLCVESPRAWQYGPVFPRAFGAHHKKRLKSSALFIEGPSFPASIKSAIDETIDFFGKYSATVLSKWTHREGSPWFIASNAGKDLHGPIGDVLIKSYFAENVVDADA
ncbi:MAG: DUF4065 domain-containing protein [Succinivibrio sp.]|nr:DUF4065 domain-containing protein [Succinivibrio sp.]